MAAGAGLWPATFICSEGRLLCAPSITNADFSGNERKIKKEKKKERIGISANQHDGFGQDLSGWA